MSAIAVAPTRPLERPPWLPPEVWPFELRGVELDGNLIHYVDEGAGPTLLFVTAGTWCIVWRDVIARLTSGFRCVALDFPYAGLSEASPGHAVGIAQHSRLLGAFVDALALDRYVLVAHDLGGPIALAMALRRPASTAGLVLTQTFGWPPESAALKGMLRLMGSAPMRELATLTRLIPLLTGTSFGVGRHLDRPSRVAFRAPFRDPAKRRAFHRLLGSVLHSSALLADVEAAAGPALGERSVLTIFGERNDPLGFQRRWQQLFPHAHRVLVPGGNHFPMSDDPDLFADSVSDWWRATAGQPSTDTP